MHTLRVNCLLHATFQAGSHMFLLPSPVTFTSMCFLPYDTQTTTFPVIFTQTHHLPCHTCSYLPLFLPDSLIPLPFLTHIHSHYCLLFPYCTGSHHSRCCTYTMSAVSGMVSYLSLTPPHTHTYRQEYAHTQVGTCTHMLRIPGGAGLRKAGRVSPA